MITVSPDVMTDRSTGLSHYLARVKIAEPERTRLGGVAIHPGMPAEAILISGERRALEYLLEPLTAALARSFKE